MIKNDSWDGWKIEKTEMQGKNREIWNAGIWNAGIEEKDEGIWNEGREREREYVNIYRVNMLTYIEWIC